MDLGQILLIFVAGLGAGAINAAAGGGSLIAFPALLAAGLPAITANVTNAVAQVPGYVGIVGGYRRELEGQSGRVKRLAPVVLAGAAAGVVALEFSSEDTFRAIVPGLILAACALLVLQPRIKARLVARRGDGEEGSPLLLDGGVFLAGAYAAYFGAAVGVMLLAILGTLIEDRLQRLNALNRTLVLFANLLAAVAFAFIAPVDWVAAAILAPATVIGGVTGASLARRLSDSALRALVVSFGLIAVVYLVATG